MSIILEMLLKGKQLEDRINGFFKTNKVGEIIGGTGANRCKGVPAIQIMLYLVSLVFTKKSMYMNMQNNTNNPGFGKPPT